MLYINGMTKEYYAKVAAVGCVVKVNGRRCARPAIVHHKTGAGMGRKSDYMDTMALCPYHHNQAPFGECVHSGTKSFEEKYGTQDELIERTRGLIGEVRER